MNYCVEKQRMACMAWITQCYMQVEESLDKCKPNEQLILKNHIFDMFDRVKFLLDKKYETIPNGSANNPKIIKGESVMRYEHERTRRHAENTIAEANRHLDSGKIKKPKHHQMLTNMVKEATETLTNLDRMENAKPYTETRIGYNADMRNRGRTATDVVADALDAINRILPKIADDADMRRGVPGTGRRSDRYDTDDRYDDDDDMDDYDTDEDMDEVVDRRGRRGRPRRTRRGVGRWTQVRRHTRRMPRSEMDDASYDDARYDDDRYEDVRRTADEARRMADDARRTAEDARRRVDDARPVMDRDDAHRPGPGMERR